MDTAVVKAIPGMRRGGREGREGGREGGGREGGRGEEGGSEGEEGGGASFYDRERGTPTHNYTRHLYLNVRQSCKTCVPEGG